MKLVIGKRGSGKTTLIKEFIKNSAYKNICIVDINSEYEYAEYDIEDLLKEFKTGIYKIILTPDYIDEFIDILNIYEHTLFVIDEFDIYEGLDYNTEYRTAIILSRHKNNDFILASRRIMRISKLITSQIDQLYSFKIIEKRDLDYIKDITSKEYIETIRNLKQYQYAMYDFTL